MTPIDFLDLQHRAREIVGTPYDKGMGDPPERHQKKRLLTITAVAGAYENASHAVIAIRGTPTRGLVIINLTHGDFDSRHLTTGRPLRRADIEVLKQLVVTASGTSLRMVPASFRWASDPPVAVKP